MRALLASVLGCAVLLAAAGPAAAEPKDLERGRAEIDKASVLVDRALEAVKDGDRERAYRLARSAYLDHYEFVEIPMRLRDPNQVLDTEFKFAAMRNDIRDGAPLSDIRARRRRRARGIGRIGPRARRQGRSPPRRSRSASRSRSCSARASRPFS